VKAKQGGPGGRKIKKSGNLFSSKKRNEFHTKLKKTPSEKYIL